MLVWRLFATLLVSHFLTVATPSQLKIWSPVHWRKKLFFPIKLEQKTHVPSVPGLIQTHGYPVETHTVRTDDGYLLMVHRIPCTFNCKAHERRQPILLNHGMLASSVIWVVAGPGKGLAFDLADAGYDVWLGNLRGNTYSRCHETLSEKDFKFWDFSWDEMAEYDVPAMIDYIYDVKSKEDETNLDHDLLYVGHSMGGTVFCAMMATKLEYNAKVRAAFLLAPVTYMAGLKAVFAWLAPLAKPIQALIRLSGHDDLLSYKTKERFSTTLLCRHSPTCEHLIFHMGAEDKLNYDPTVLMELTAFIPAGTSTRTARHYTQLAASKSKFQKYDYGRAENVNVYGHTQPPAYNLSVITTPIGLFYSDADFLVTKVDAERTFNEMKATIGLFKVEAKNFGHNEFTLGRRAPEMVNKPILQLLEDFR